MQVNSKSTESLAKYKLPNKIQIVLSVLLVLIVIFWVWVSGNTEKRTELANNKTDSAALNPDAFKVTHEQFTSLQVANVLKNKFQTTQVTEGKIALNADHNTPVFSPYSGRIIKLIANLGDHVAENTPLFSIQATEYVQGNNDFLAASNAYKSSASQLSLATTNEQRKHALYDSQGGTLQDWQQSQSDLVVAKNNMASAETTLSLARNKLRILGKTDEEISKLEGQSNISSEVIVRSPISGSVIDRQLSVGQFIQAGAANPQYTIANLSTVWIVANVRETDISDIKLGQTVLVRVLALPDKKFKAKITYIAPSLDPSTRRVSVRAEISNPDGILKPEMYANFSISTGPESESPSIPERAIVYEGDKAHVWVVEGEDSVSLRQVKVGRVINGAAEIISGLEEGEKVVTSGTLFIDRAAKQNQ